MNNFTTNTYEMKREISNFRVYISILTPNIKMQLLYNHSY